jgi:AcrR family transcriptional regulator
VGATTVPERVLDAAAELVIAHDVGKLTMRDVADRAGVSRQTVYNEFGDRTGLLEALVLRETGRLLDGIEAILGGPAGPHEAVRDAVGYLLAEARRSPLIRASLAGDGSAEVVELLTTRGRPVLLAAIERVAGVLRARWPLPDPGLTAETAVRLAVSHLLLALDPPDRAAEKVARAVTAMLRSAP